MSSVPYAMVGSKVAKPMARYHPSLSGSETDVSTSTENLTQVGHSYIFENFISNIYKGGLISLN